MDAQRDTSAPKPYVRLASSIAGADRRLLPRPAVGRREVSLPLPEDIGRLAVHTGAVF